LTTEICSARRFWQPVGSCPAIEANLLIHFAATLVIATWVHNEPGALTIIQESKLPDSFYQVVEQGIEPMIEVIKNIGLGQACS
jgi:hypothetical protein